MGAITGTVKDTSGGIIPGATVGIVNSATGIENTTISQADGAFLAPQIPPGDYRLTVSSPGFKQVEFLNLKVNVGTTLTRDVTLEVGQLTESVRVEG